MMADKPRGLNIPERLETFFACADHVSGGWLSTLRRTLDSFVAAHGTQAAAGLAYYGLFSLIPLIVLVATVLSYFIDPVQVGAMINVALDQLLPDGQGVENLLVDTVRSVVASRGQVTVISLLALLWAASGMFTNLTYNIDLAWSKQRRANPIKARLIGLLMVVLVYLGLLALLLSSAILGVLSWLPGALLRWLGVDDQLAQAWAVRGVSLLISVGVFYGLYHWVPRALVPRAVAFWSALAVSLVIQVLNFGFTWYLSSGLSNYERLYGPLTTIIVLMFWFYMTVTVVLIGAHLSAALADRRQTKTSIEKPSQT